MAFDASNLSVLAYANNFTLWHYASIDNTATITGAGYFNKAVEYAARQRPDGDQYRY